MRTSIAAFAAALGLASSARADIIAYEQLPGPNSNTGFLSAVNNLSAMPPGAIVADNFVLPTSTTISGLHFWGVLEGGGHDFRYTFYANNGGIPGAILLSTGGSSPTLSNPPSAPVPSTFYETELDTPFFATAGTTYWLSVYNQKPGATWGWLIATNSGDGSRQGDDIVPLWNSSRPDMAFQLTTVPAPPSVVLVGLGAGCVAVRRYMGRRATA
jgi:hypothetical protein